MNFTEAVKTCLTKYVDFEGRAGRPEFWWFALFQFILMAVIGMFSNALQGVISLALLLPGLGVGARRLHDIGKSGWFLLLWLVPFVGWLVLLYWAIQPSQAGSNAWGASPAGAAASPVAATDVTKSPGEQ
jgi:uncharacterized membrane protein YhaH (DUF805 family)